jgi:ABC-type Fe3+-hydroxamate transport system substrate-binding protein
MIPIPKRTLLLLLMTLILLFTAIGCGSSNTANSPTVGAANSEAVNKTAESTPKSTDAAQKTQGTYPITIKHPKGETVIKQMPKKVAVIFEWYNADNLLSLGIKPVAITNDPAWYSNDLGVASYLVEDLKGIQILGDRSNPDLEKLALAKPDLILTINVPFLEEKYSQFNKIAPTIMMDGFNGDWKAYHRQIAAIFDQVKQAEQTFQEIDKKMAETKSKLEKSMGSDNLAIVQILPKTLRLFGKKDPVTDLLYKELGVKPAPEAEKLEGISEISLESLAKMDPDRILIYWTTAERFKPIAETSVWKNLKAVKNGKVYFPESTVEWNPSGPIGRSKLLDRITETFTSTK